MPRTDRETVTFRSRREGWTVGMASAPVVILGGLLGYLLAANGRGRALWLVAAAAVVYAVLVRVYLFPVRYEVGRDHLTVRSGVQRVSIPLAEIERVEPTTDRRSESQLSLDRLRVTYRTNGRETVRLLTPRDAARFLDTLARTGAGLERRGGELVRRER